jgi:hypothetical protein
LDFVEVGKLVMALDVLGGDPAVVLALGEGGFGTNLFVCFDEELAALGGSLDVRCWTVVNFSQVEFVDVDVVFSWLGGHLDMGLAKVTVWRAICFRSVSDLSLRRAQERLWVSLILLNHRLLHHFGWRQLVPHVLDLASLLDEQHVVWSHLGLLLFDGVEVERWPLQWAVPAVTVGVDHYALLLRSVQNSHLLQTLLECLFGHGSRRRDNNLLLWFLVNHWKTSVVVLAQLNIARTASQNLLVHFFSRRITWAIRLKGVALVQNKVLAFTDEVLAGDFLARMFQVHMFESHHTLWARALEAGCQARVFEVGGVGFLNSIQLVDACSALDVGVPFFTILYLSFDCRQIELFAIVFEHA